MFLLPSFKAPGHNDYWGHILVQLYCVAIGMLTLEDSFCKQVPPKLEATAIAIVYVTKCAR